MYLQPPKCVEASDHPRCNAEWRHYTELSSSLRVIARLAPERSVVDFYLDYQFDLSRLTLSRPPSKVPCTCILHSWTRELRSMSFFANSFPRLSNRTTSC